MLPPRTVPRRRHRRRQRRRQRQRQRRPRQSFSLSFPFPLFLHMSSPKTYKNLGFLPRSAPGAERRDGGPCYSVTTWNENFPLDLDDNFQKTKEHHVFSFFMFSVSKASLAQPARPQGFAETLRSAPGGAYDPSWRAWISMDIHGYPWIYGY